MISELKRHLKGEVFDQDADRKRYARDESIFWIVPTVVVCPKDEEDVRTALSIAEKHSIPITARGGGTGVAGQAIGEGIILDFSRHMNAILDNSENTVRVQPGIILDALNARLQEAGRRIAPDPSSRASCSVGGMVGNNASGPHSFAFGCTRDHVISLRGLLPDGTRFTDSRIRMPEVQEVERLVQAHERKVRERPSSTRKNSSGYALRAYLDNDFDFTRLLVGSEGTLGLITEIEMTTIPLPTKTVTGVFAFPSMKEAIATLDEFRCLGPVGIEVVDDTVLKAIARIDSSFVASLGIDRALASLWIEWEENRPSIEKEYSVHWLENAKSQRRLWELRSLASKELQKQGGVRKPLRCIEDAAVPPNRLAEYLEHLREILHSHDCDGAIFGHAGDAHIHVNPMIDVSRPDLPERIEKLMEDASQLVFSMGGTLSGEHGDGLLRRSGAERQWGDLYPVFQELKNHLDPKGLLNPGKKVSIQKDAPRPDFRRLMAESPVCVALPPSAIAAPASG